MVGHESALDEASKHQHKGHTGYNKITKRTQRKLMNLLQAPRQIACLPAAEALAGCVLCVVVSHRGLGDVLWEVAHGGPHPNLGRAGLAKATWRSPFHQGNTDAACDDERYAAFLTRYVDQAWCQAKSKCPGGRHVCLWSAFSLSE